MPEMPRSLTLRLLTMLCAALLLPAFAQEAPLETDLEEEVGVHLVLVDSVVLDRDGRTVPDLRLEDFEIVVDGEAIDADTLDRSCEGAMDDPRSVRVASRREPLPSRDTRRIVLLIDYLHLGMISRTDVLGRAREMVRHGLTDNDEVMVVALTGGLRIEQMFTADRELVEETLERMEYDISLWNGNFYHLTEESFFASMNGLLNVLGNVPGHKGIVMFSNLGAAANENDLWLSELAANAARSRCSLYPVLAAGLQPDRPG